MLFKYLRKRSLTKELFNFSVIPMFFLMSETELSPLSLAVPTFNAKNDFESFSNNWLTFLHQDTVCVCLKRSSGKRDSLIDGWPWHFPKIASSRSYRRRKESELRIWQCQQFNKKCLKNNVIWQRFVKMREPFFT